MLPDESYERGHIAGGIAERLDSHDRHFSAINGSLADVARELHVLNMGMQRLGDQADASARTVITTAAALKDAVKTQQEAMQAQQVERDRAWSPMARLVVVVSGLAATVSIVVALAALFG